LVQLGVADTKVLRNLVRHYQGNPENGSTVVIWDLIALELICREMLGESASSATMGSIYQQKISCNR
jgi:hypothetical protein